MEIARKDSLPEYHDYRDDGCEVAPKCLECPLEQCRYDVDGGVRSIENAERDARIERRHRAGWDNNRIALSEGTSLRTVQRVLAERRLTREGKQGDGAGSLREVPLLTIQTQAGDRMHERGMRLPASGEAVLDMRGVGVSLRGVDLPGVSGSGGGGSEAAMGERSAGAGREEKEEGERERAVAAYRGNGGTRSGAIAAAGVTNGVQYAQLLTALMADVLDGEISPSVANAAISAGSQLLKLLELHKRYSDDS